MHCLGSVQDPEEHSIELEMKPFLFASMREMVSQAGAKGVSYAFILHSWSSRYARWAPKAHSQGVSERLTSY